MTRARVCAWQAFCCLALRTKKLVWPRRMPVFLKQNGTEARPDFRFGVRLGDPLEWLADEQELTAAGSGGGEGHSCVLRGICSWRAAWDLSEIYRDVTKGSARRLAFRVDR